jgi:ribosomal protein S18 acetylase RimI-like enzyme
MTPAFQIANFTDTTRIEELHNLVLAAFRDLSIDPPSSVLKESVSDFLTRLRTETAIVAQAEGALVGAVFCAAKDDSLYVGRLAVRDDFRRRGAASALLQAASAEARRRALPRLTLSTRIALASNVALFSKHGFVVVAEQSHPGFSYPTSYDMELRLG